MPRKLDSLALTVSSISNALLQLAVVIMVAQYMGSAATGRYALAQSYIIPAMFLGMLGLRTQALLDKESRYVGTDFFAIRTIYGGVLFLATLALVAVVESAAILPIAAALAVVKMLDGYTDIMLGLLQRCQQMRAIMMQALSRLVIGLIGFYGGYLVFDDLVIALLTLSVALAVHMVWVEYRFCRRHITFQGSWVHGDVQQRASRRTLLKLGIPWGIAILLGNLQFSAIRIILDKLQSPEVVGYFSVTLQLIVVGHLVICAISNAYVPHMQAAHEANQPRKFIKSLVMLSGLVLGCVGAGIGIALLIGGWIIETVFGSEFAGLDSLLLTACFAAIPIYLTAAISSAYLACKIGYMQMWVNAAGLLLMVAGAYYWIPEHGAQGAYYALSAALGVQLLISIAVIAWMWKRQPETA